MMGLLDLEKVISLTGFKSHVLHSLNILQIKKKKKERKNEMSNSALKMEKKHINV